MTDQNQPSTTNQTTFLQSDCSLANTNSLYIDKLVSKLLYNTGASSLHV